MCDPEAAPIVVKVYYGTSRYYDSSEPWISPLSQLESEDCPFGPKKLDKTLLGITNVRMDLKKNLNKLMKVLFGPGEKEIRHTEAHKKLSHMTHSLIYLPFPNAVARSRSDIASIVKQTRGSTLQDIQKSHLMFLACRPFLRFLGVDTMKEAGAIIQPILGYFAVPLSDTSFPPFLPYKKILFRKLLLSLCDEPNFDLDDAVPVISGILLTFTRTVVRYALQVLDRVIKLSHGESDRIIFNIRHRPSCQDSGGVVSSSKFNSNLLKKSYQWDHFDVEIKELSKKSYSYVDLIRGDDEMQLLAIMLQPTASFSNAKKVIDEHIRRTNKCFMDQLAKMIADFKDSFKSNYHDIMKSSTDTLMVLQLQGECDEWDEMEYLNKRKITIILRSLIGLFSPFYCENRTFSINNMVERIFLRNDRLVAAKSYLSRGLLCRILGKSPAFLGVIQKMASKADLNMKRGDVYFNVINTISQSIQFFFYKLLFHLLRPLIKAAIVSNPGMYERNFQLYSCEYYERTHSRLPKPVKLIAEDQNLTEEPVIVKEKGRKRKMEPKSSDTMPIGSHCDPEVRSENSRHRNRSPTFNTSHSECKLKNTTNIDAQESGEDEDASSRTSISSLVEGYNINNDSRSSKGKKMITKAKDNYSDLDSSFHHACSEHIGSSSYSGTGTAVYDRVMANFEKNTSISDDVKLIFATALRSKSLNNLERCCC